MKKIRIGNDFVFNWAIERGGLPEDLSSVLEKHLHLSVFDKRVELIEGVDYDIIGNVIRIEVTPAIANIIGTYKVEFHYILPDNGLIDDDRKCAVDVDAFQIVAKTAQADDSSEFSVTSDMAIAFKGDKGDSAYKVWLNAGNTGTEEDYLAYLRQPAIDAAQNANEAADFALTATQEATTAASLADTARLAIQTDLAQKADHGYDAEETPKTLKEVDDEVIQLAGDVDVNLIATYTHTTNTVIQPTALDPVTGIFTCNNHGLTQNKGLSWNLNRNHNLLPYQVIPIEINGGQYGNYYADVIDANSFKIKKTPTDAPLTYASAGDITKWHFETDTVAFATITNLPAYKKIKVITKFISNSNFWFQLYPTNVGGTTNSWYINGAITNAQTETYNLLGSNMPAYVESYLDFGEISTIRHKIYGFTHVHTSPTTVTREKPADLCWINFDNLGALTITDLRVGSPNRRLLNGTTVEIYKI